jgi:hypothetical protein
VEHISSLALLSKVFNKSVVFVVRAIEANLNHLNSVAKTLTVKKGQQLAEHLAIDQTLGPGPTLPVRIAVSSAAATRT